MSNWNLIQNELISSSQLTLLHDLELKELTKGVIVPEGGVKENNIHKVMNWSFTTTSTATSTTSPSSRSCCLSILPMLMPLRKIAALIQKFERDLGSTSDEACEKWTSAWLNWWHPPSTTLQWTNWICEPLKDILWTFSATQDLILDRVQVAKTFVMKSQDC